MAKVQRAGARPSTTGLAASVGLMSQADRTLRLMRSLEAIRCAFDEGSDPADLRDALRAVSAEARLLSFDEGVAWTEYARSYQLRTGHALTKIAREHFQAGAAVVLAQLGVSSSAVSPGNG